MNQLSESLFGPRHEPPGSVRNFEPTISCILPWRGTADGLRSLVLPLLDDVSSLVRLWELILVDDGCSSADAAAMTAWTQVEGIRIVRLARHFGRHAAIAAGLQRANGDLVVVLQGDDARASELIAGLLAKWRQGFDVVHSSASHAHHACSLATHSPEPPGTPGSALASMRTTYRALLIDGGALSYFVTPHADAFGLRYQHVEHRLRVAAVPAPPLLTSTPPAPSTGLAFSAAVKWALRSMRQAGQALGAWIEPSAVDPLFEIREELGSGLALRSRRRAPLGAGGNEKARSHG